MTAFNKFIPSTVIQATPRFATVSVSHRPRRFVASPQGNAITRHSFQPLPQHGNGFAALNPNLTIWRTLFNNGEVSRSYTRVAYSIPKFPLPLDYEKYVEKGSRMALPSTASHDGSAYRTQSSKSGLEPDARPLPVYRSNEHAAKGKSGEEKRWIKLR